MSLLNKKECKEVALKYAEEHQPHKTRVSADFIRQLDELVDHIVEAMVRDNDCDAKTLNSCDWATTAIKKGKKFRDNKNEEEDEPEDPEINEEE